MSHNQRSQHRRGLGVRRMLFSYYGVMLAVLVASTLLLVGCGARSQTATALPPRATTPTATVTPVPVPPLAFRPIRLPPGFHAQSDTVAASPMDEPPLAVSPVNGKDAWACVAVGAGDFQIWATTDEGSTWHTAGLLHPTTPTPPVQCGVVADQHDAQAAVFGVEWGEGSGAAGYLYSTSFYTWDGGAHWRQLPGWTRVFSLDTDGANSYALVAAMTPPLAQRQQPSALLAGTSPPRFSAPGFGPFSPDYANLVVSHDGLQTWRVLHPGGVPTGGDPPLQYWHGSTSGDLFVATVSGAFWHSSDSGVSWAQSSTLGTPDMQNSLGMWLASRKAWMFCGWQQIQPLVVMCSADAGNSWRQVPGLARTWHCGQQCSKDGGSNSPTDVCPPFALASDGALLAACPPNGTGPAPDQFMTYRLAPGASDWAPLGAAPATPRTVSANGIMWCLNAQDTEWETVAVPV